MTSIFDPDYKNSGRGRLENIEDWAGRFSGVGSMPDSVLGVKRPWLPEANGVTFMETFAAGHGWAGSAGAGGSMNLNDTNTPGPFVPQTISCVNGTAGTARAQKQSLGTFDLTGKSVLVWFKLTNYTAGAPGIVLYLSTDTLFTQYYLGQVNGFPGATTTGVYGPESGWWCYEFFPAAMTATGGPNIASITSVRIDVNSSGVQGGGSPSNIGVSIGGLGYRTPPTAYPNGVVTFTFDDANASDFTLARTTLGKYGFPGVSYVIADAVGSTGPTAAQYRQMQDQLGWEVAGHAYTTAAHDTSYENLSAGALQTELRNLRGWLLANGFPSESWASPHGTATETVWASAREYFTSHRNAGYVANWLTKPQQAAPAVRPHMLIAPTWDVSAGATVAQFKAAIDATKTNKAWLIFNMHAVTSAASSGLNISSSDLDQLAAYCQSQGVAVRTVRGVLNDVGVAL